MSKKMDQAILDNIEKMPAQGNRLELPKYEQFTNYPALKKCLLAAGAKYSKCGFVFPEDAQVIKDRLLGGELIDDKKKFQFFATPPELATQLVEMADIKPTDMVLEPSAGQGAIADLLQKKTNIELCVVELMPANCKVLIRKDYRHVIERDFLTLHKEDIGSFDKIVANPPFTKNHDIDHIRHMYKFLSPGGKLVSVASPSWTFGSQKKQVAFREWLEEVGATITDIPAGAFKESGTSIRSVVVEIEKS